MAKIHMSLQGKGGVGKSFTSTMTAQCNESRGTPTKNIDTDPQNATFHAFTALNVQHVNLIENKEINTRKFDELIEIIATLEQDAVIDTGSNSFFQLTNYLISNQVPQLIKDMGHELIIHTPVTGGQAMLETLSGFSQLAQQLPEEAKLVVWLNPFWGPIEHDGKTFEQMKAYRDNKDRVTAIIQVPDVKAETYGKDVSDMLKANKTFAEALDDASLPIMVRQRLKIVRDALFKQILASTVV